MPRAPRGCDRTSRMWSVSLLRDGGRNDSRFLKKPLCLGQADRPGERGRPAGLSPSCSLRGLTLSPLSLAGPQSVRISHDPFHAPEATRSNGLRRPDGCPIRGVARSAPIIENTITFTGCALVLCWLTDDIPGSPQGLFGCSPAHDCRAAAAQGAGADTAGTGPAPARVAALLPAAFGATNP